MRPFKQVDVFTDQPLYGNPLAVVFNGQGIDTEVMQRFTDWTNLSECTFLAEPTHPDADYAVRIFCPGRELPFAGHPTLGSCHAWLQAGGSPKKDVIIQECGVGLVRIQRDDGRLSFAAPPLRKSGPLSEPDVARIAKGLGIVREDIVAHAWCDNGPNWRGVMLRSAEQVLSIKPDATVLVGLDVGVVGPRGKVGILGPQAAAHDTQFEVRAFFPGNTGLAEDPVTGSLNAAMAQWLIGDGLAPQSYVVSQGTALNRKGRVFVNQSGEDIWIGGHCVTVLEGVANL
jgi:PhzF family phenazine biosynthesis protein